MKSPSMNKSSLLVSLDIESKIAVSCSSIELNCGRYFRIALCPKMQIRREVTLHEMFLFVGIEVLY